MECLQTKLRLDVATNDPRTISDFDSWHVLFFRKKTNPVACTIKCQDIIVNGKSDVFTNHVVLGTEDIEDMTPIYVKTLHDCDKPVNFNYPLLADFSIMHPYGNINSPRWWNNGLPVKATTEELASYFSSNNSSINIVNIGCEDITGDIGALSTLTGLTSLGLGNANVTGDIEPIIEKCTSLKQLTIPATVTITDAQKKTLTDRGCTIVIK